MDNAQFYASIWIDETETIDITNFYRIPDFVSKFMEKNAILQLIWNQFLYTIQLYTLYWNLLKNITTGAFYTS